MEENKEDEQSRGEATGSHDESNTGDVESPSFDYRSLIVEDDNQKSHCLKLRLFLLLEQNILMQ